MLDFSPTPTEDDIQTLVDKLIEFDAGLNAAQRSVFRARIVATLPGAEEVEGHAWEMRWEAGAAAMFRQWVWIEDGRDRESSRPPSKEGSTGVW